MRVFLLSRANHTHTVGHYTVAEDWPDFFLLDPISSLTHYASFRCYSCLLPLFRNRNNTSWSPYRIARMNKDLRYLDNQNLIRLWDRASSSYFIITI